jgi:DNA-binding MarR family transcriptional regulator
MPDINATRISYTVKWLEAALRSHLDSICRPHGITTMQYVVLSVLNVHPGMSSAQLAVRSFVSPQSSHQMIVGLESAGLIERRPDPLNRRVLKISLTDDGRKVLSSCDRDVDELERRMLQSLDENEALAVRSALNRCILSLSPVREIDHKLNGAGRTSGTAPMAGMPFPNYRT